jgi:hypothetical protein
MIRILPERRISRPLVRPFPRPVMVNDKSLIAHYVFDREGRLTDLSGMGNHGTITGATWTSKGRYGSALSFDGLDDVITLANKSNFDFGANTDFSFVYWINPTAAGDTRYLFTKDVSMLFMRINDDDKVRCRVQDGVPNTADAITTGTVNEGVWNHIVVTADRDSATGLKIYMDSVLDGNTSVDMTGVGDINDNNSARIGFSASTFSGVVDSVMVFKKALTAIEVRDLYEAGL